MKAGGMFITAILVVDTFFVSYYAGIHSRTVDVEDPSIKPIEQPASAKKVEAAKSDTDSKKSEQASEKHKGSKSKTNKKKHKAKT